MSITLSTSDMIKLNLLLSEIKNGAKTATYRAINKTLSGVQTDAVQEVYDELNLTKTRIRKDFTVKKAFLSNPSGHVKASGKPVGLSSFSGTRQTQKGVSVKVKRVRKVLKHAFVAEAKNALNVWWRAYSGARSKKMPALQYARLPRFMRFPIIRLTGPRIEDILAHENVMKVVMKKAGDRYLKNIDHEASYLLSKHK
jgi:hypothetical protein